MRSIRDNLAIVVGLILSLAWLTFGALFVFLFGHRSEFTALKLNEFGDFVAGISAPLAFLWLVITVFMQRQELRLQREELEQNREVLKLQIEELKTTSTQLRSQTALLEVGAKDRENEKRFHSWRAKLLAVIEDLANPDRDANRFVKTAAGTTSFKIAPIHSIPTDELELNLSRHLRQANKDLVGIRNLIEKNQPASLHSSLPISCLIEAESHLQVLKGLVEEVSHLDLERVESMVETKELRRFSENANKHGIMLVALLEARLPPTT